MFQCLFTWILSKENFLGEISSWQSGNTVRVNKKFDLVFVEDQDILKQKLKLFLWLFCCHGSQEQETQCRSGDVGIGEESRGGEGQEDHGPIPPDPERGSTQSWEDQHWSGFPRPHHGMDYL